MCYFSDQAMNKFVTSASVASEEKDAKVKTEQEPSDIEMFKLGVEWWSEIFIFYGILSAIAVWEIGKFQKKSRV